MLSTTAGTVFVRSHEGRGPTVLLLHGFPSSSYDFRGVVDRLGDQAWITLDFLGFGLSDKPRHRRSQAVTPALRQQRGHRGRQVRRV
jgi:pimeloyl-ACP methyl ester carboxylesterase